MSCNPEVLQFTLSLQTNLLKIHCRRFLYSHSRIKLKLIKGKRVNLVKPIEPEEDDEQDDEET